MLGLLSRGSLLRRTLAPLVPAAPATIFARGMSVLKSASVKHWLGERAIESPTKFRPYLYEGKWRKPELNNRKQAILAKEAIRRGELKLEPVRMVPPPAFRGWKRDREKPIRRAEVAKRMEEMPAKIAEYRQERRIRRAKWKEANRWK